MRAIRFRPRLLVTATACIGLASCSTPQDAKEEGPQIEALPLADVSDVPVANLLQEADAAHAAGRLGDAQAGYLDLLSQEPGNRTAALGLADTLYELGDFDAALSRYRSVLTSGGSKTQVAHAQLGIGLVQRQKGQLPAARTSLEAAVQGDPSLWKGWLALGQMHQEAGRTAMAETAFANARKTGADVAEVHNDIGMWHLARKEPKEAVAAFDRALKLDSTLDVARGNLRLAHAMDRDYASALAGASGPELPEILNNVGYMAIVNGDLDTAQQLLTQAVDTSPYHNAPALANLALLRDLRSQGGSVVQ